MESQGFLLVVDDSEANRDMLSRRLERRGYTVEMAAGGREALERVRETRYDVILLDLMMPDIDGMQVLRTLRETWSAAELPVIIVTAKDESADIVEGLKAGANDYVTKPLDMPVVVARVQTQVSLKRAVDQIRLLEHTLAERNVALEAANRELTAANVRMARELASAARIQQAMLPAALPKGSAAQFAWLFRPCAEIAGDSLNVFQLDANHVGMYVLDVVGHGIAAALLSVAVSRILSPAPNSFLLRPSHDGKGYLLRPPAEVGDELNRRFPWDSATEQFFTLVYGVLDVRTREFRFVCAGHPPPVHIARGAELSVLNGPAGVPIGVAESGYVEQCVRLEMGDRIYCYSDGLPEAMNAQNEPYTTERLLDCIRGARGSSLPQSLDALWKDVEAWCGGTALHDDASLVALEVGA